MLLRLVFVLAPHLFAFSHTFSNFGKSVKIGVLFDIKDKDSHLSSALHSAVEMVNSARNIRYHPLLSYELQAVAPYDSLSAHEKMCKLLKNSGAMAILGPQSMSVSVHVESVCDVFRIPHVGLHKDFRLRKDESSVILAPHPRSLGRAVADVIRTRPWYTEFVIIYENEEGLWRLQEVLTIPGATIRIQRLSENGDFRPQLKEIMASKIYRIVLDCSIENVKFLLEQAEEVNMINEHYDYIIINLDLFTVNLEMFENHAVNITGFRLVDTKFQDYEKIIANPYLSVIFPSFSGTNLETERRVPLEFALLYDSFLIFLYAFASVDVNSLQPLSCENQLDFHQVNSVVEKLQKIQLSGLTGPIHFNKYGFRTNFNLTITKLVQGHHKEQAVWNERNGLSFLVSEQQMKKETEESILNKLVKITTIKNPPFIMEIPPEERTSESGKYKGFIVDLVKAMESTANFKSEITLVADGKYGDNKTGIWNGMVGEIMDQKATAAIADLTITRLRQDAVDFTNPFMNLGISILFKKPKKAPRSLFSFLDPFVTEVWICMGTAYLGVSVVLYMLSRLSPEEWESAHPCRSEQDHLRNNFTLLNCMWFGFGSFMQQGCDFLPKLSPNEWRNPHPCNLYPEELENTFDLLNSFWFTIGSLMKQGSDLSPKAVSTRIVAALWWFFTLIIISSYTANLAAFLTSARLTPPIKSAEDLSRQVNIKYGCVQGGSTQSFFASSQSELYANMWKFMQATEPSVFTETNNEGKERVKKGRYAFFMESVFIQYMTERDCDLMEIGHPLDDKGYGIATKKGSAWRNIFNRAVLTLQEDGTILRLKRKWWERPKEEGKCDDNEVKDKMEESKLGVENVGGVFLLLTIGLSFALVVGVGEFIWNIHKTVIERSTFSLGQPALRTTVMKELKFVLNCSSETKPVEKLPNEQYQMYSYRT